MSAIRAAVTGRIHSLDETVHEIVDEWTMASEQNFDILICDARLVIDALGDELTSDVDVALASLAVTRPL